MAERTAATDRITDLIFNRASVSAVEQITPRMRRISLTDERIKTLACVPGQQVRILVTDLFSAGTLRHLFRESLRTYSVWHHDPASGTLELCVLDHGDGPGARWARQLEVGDDVRFKGPDGKFVVTQASYHLFVGEETAQVAFGAMLASLKSRASVHGVIELDNEADRLPVCHADAIAWPFRHGAAAADSGSLVEALGSLDLPADPGHAYLAGEARTCQAARRHLVDERGWPTRAISVKPFWTPGKRGLE